MASFINVPKLVLVEVFSSWCSLKELTLLDTSLCDETQRLYFHQLIASEVFVSDDNKACVQFELENYFPLSGITWMQNHSVNLRYVKFGVPTLPKNHLIFSGPFLIFVEVESITIDNCDRFVLPRDSLIQLINSCLNLKSIVLRKVECGFTTKEIDPSILSQLEKVVTDNHPGGRYQSYEEYSHFMSPTKEYVSSWEIVTNCPNLTCLNGGLYRELFAMHRNELNIRDDEEYHEVLSECAVDSVEGDILVALQRLGKLREILIGHPTEGGAGDELLRTIAQFCPLFEKIDMQFHAAYTSLEAIGEFINSCVHLKSMELAFEDWDHDSPIENRSFEVTFHSADLLRGRYIKIKKFQRGGEVEFFRKVKNFDTVFLDEVYVSGKLIRLITQHNQDTLKHLKTLRCKVNYKCKDLQCLLETCKEMHTLQLSNFCSLNDHLLYKLFSSPNHTLTDVNLSMHDKLTTSTVLLMLDNCPNIHTLAVDMCQYVVYREIREYLREHNRQLTFGRYCDSDESVCNTFDSLPQFRNFRLGYHCEDGDDVVSADMDSLDNFSWSGEYRGFLPQFSGCRNNEPENEITYLMGNRHTATN